MWAVEKIRNTQSFFLEQLFDFDRMPSQTQPLKKPYYLYSMTLKIFSPKFVIVEKQQNKGSKIKPES